MNQTLPATRTRHAAGIAPSAASREIEAGASERAAAGNVSHYIRIARPDHWFKNVLILPGTAAASILTSVGFTDYAFALFVGVVSTCLVTSANYALNEWLDAPFDRFHPLKKNRPSVKARLDPRLVWLEYAALSLGGLVLALSVSLPFFIMSAALWVQGLAYNVKPFRTKDRVFLDVLSESVNNPIRLLLGWFIVANHPFPPSSLVLSYWMLGAFLMTIKRYAEMRFLGSPEVAACYRRSFRVYTEENLLISAMLYAFTSAFFLSIFTLVYRLELVLTLPFLASAFAWYIHIGMKPESPAQTPERLYQQRGFVSFLVLTAALMWLAFAIDFPWLASLLENPFSTTR